MMPSARHAGQLTAHVLLVAALLLVVLVIAHNIDKGEFNINLDEGAHAMTGLYFADFIRDFPLAHPVQYTFNYYAQYPALGLVLWPPLFHFVEGVAFLVLDPSVVSARLTIILFALLGLWFWFKFVREIQDQWTAIAATLLLALLPEVLLYEKAVMLEIPSLALCLAASYFWIRYLSRGQSRYLYWFTVAFAFALLTKQHSIYLGVFCLLTVVSERKVRLLLGWSTVRAAAVFLLLVLPFYSLAFAVTWQTVSDNILNRAAEGSSLTYYWRQLPSQLGPVILVWSFIGAVTAYWWGSRQSVMRMAIWIIACYVTMTAFAGKEPRYMIYWLPAFVYFAVCPLTVKPHLAWLRPVQLLILAVVLSLYTVRAWNYQRPYVDGYADVARHLTSQTSGPEIILYDAELHENFMFFLRAYDPERRFVVMRKALHVARIAADRGSRELVRNAEEIQDLLARYGIRYIVVSDSGPLEFAVQKTLRELLNTPQFRLVGRFPIETHLSAAQSHMLLYENTEAVPRTEQWISLEMLTMSQDIRVSLDDLIR